jgi:hypothetical protein
MAAHLRGVFDYQTERNGAGGYEFEVDQDAYAECKGGAVIQGGKLVCIAQKTR